MKLAILPKSIDDTLKVIIKRYTYDILIIIYDILARKTTTVCHSYVHSWSAIDELITKSCRLHTMQNKYFLFI